MVIHQKKKPVKKLSAYEVSIWGQASFEGGRLTMVGIRIDRWKKILLDNKTLSEICKSSDRFRFTVVAVLQDDESIISLSISNFAKATSLILYLSLI